MNSEIIQNENKHETKLTHTCGCRRDHAGRPCCCAGPGRRLWRPRTLSRRSGICHGAFDQGVEPDARPAIEGPTAGRSGASADHRHPQGRDGKDARDHGQNDVANPSNSDTGPAEEVRRVAKGPAGPAQCDAGTARGDVRIISGH